MSNALIKKKNIKNKYKLIVISGLIGLVLGVVLTVFVDYFILKNENLTVIFSKPQNILKKWNSATKIEQQEIVISVLVRFPNLINDAKKNPNIWQVINSYIENHFYVSLPRPAYKPFIDQDKHSPYSSIGLFFVEHKKQVYKDLDRINIDDLTNYWDNKYISSDRNKLKQNWDKQVLLSASKKLSPKLYQDFKLDFLAS